jgi:hypothetical protein
MEYYFQGKKTNLHQQSKQIHKRHSFWFGGKGKGVVEGGGHFEASKKGPKSFFSDNTLPPRGLFTPSGKYGARLK